MSDQIIPEINETLCNGCGDCLTTCQPRALALVAGKAVVARPDLCEYDGGCEPVCPVGAIQLPYLVVFADLRLPARATIPTNLPAIGIPTYHPMTSSIPFDDALAPLFDVMTDWEARLATEGPFLRAMLAEVGVRRVLDAACGSGGHALWLAQQGFDASGVDASPAMIELARRKAAAAGVAVGFGRWRT